MRGLGGRVVEVGVVGAVFGVWGGSVENVDGRVGARGGGVDEAFVVSVMRKMVSVNSVLLKMFLGTVRYCGIVKRLKQGLYHAVQLVCPYLLVCSIVFELDSGLLPPCPRL